MGKSFWTHALVDQTAKGLVSDRYGLLKQYSAVIGFNGSDRYDGVAPTALFLADALRQDLDPLAIWRTVLVLIALNQLLDYQRPNTVGGFVEWVKYVIENSEFTEEVIRDLDDALSAKGRKLLVLFDALDRLADDWSQIRSLTKALLRLTLGVQSYRSVRIKLFMRRDQFEDEELFRFADGSKIRNSYVDLRWEARDLYRLLFTRLQTDRKSASEFVKMKEQLNSGGDISASDQDMRLVESLAGQFMGATDKRGRVYTWLPLHLADAHDETSPRTFLTVWCTAAKSGQPPVGRAVDHLGLLEGVRKASADRMAELREDYPWIDLALHPLNGLLVPLDRKQLFDLWIQNQTSRLVLDTSRNKIAPVQMMGTDGSAEESLLEALKAIGILEERNNGKINVPDIYRVEAGIKRKGGVKPPGRHQNR